MSLIITEELVRETLRDVYDPELGINVVDLGLVYGIEASPTSVQVTMTLTTPGCPLHDLLTEAVDRAIRSIAPDIESVRVNLVWCPPWSPEMITPAGRRELGWC